MFAGASRLSFTTCQTTTGVLKVSLSVADVFYPSIYCVRRLLLLGVFNRPWPGGGRRRVHEAGGTQRPPSTLSGLRPGSNIHIRMSLQKKIRRHSRAQREIIILRSIDPPPFSRRLALVIDKSDLFRGGQRFGTIIDDSRHHGLEGDVLDRKQRDPIKASW